MNLVLITYEFTYSPFSGNGILARSLVKSVLRHRWQNDDDDDLKNPTRMTVWCCRPSMATSPDHHLEQDPEMPENSLTTIAVTLPPTCGWKQLDEQAAWQEFHWENLEKEPRQTLSTALQEAHAVLVIDWTGACAWRSIPWPYILDGARHNNKPPPPMVYLSFRVYSSGVVDRVKHDWYDHMERMSLDDASIIVTLSEKDEMSLQAMILQNNNRTRAADTTIEVLLPPLRGDVEQLANMSAEELHPYLPPEALAALGTLVSDEATNPSTDRQEPRRHHRQRIFVTCVARLGREKQVMRFVRFVEATTPDLFWDDDTDGPHQYIPLLAGANSDPEYSQQVKQALRRVQPNAVIIDHFLSSKALAAVFAHSVVNFHPCGYEAYGMTIVEAAVFGAPSILNGNDGQVGASALLGDNASIPIDMCPSSETISTSSIQDILAVVQDEERLESIGQLARQRALAWNEDTYGKRLLELVHLSMKL